LRVCSFPDDQGCTFIFRYLINNSTVEVQRTKHCGGDTNILGECLFCSSSLTQYCLLRLLILNISDLFVLWFYNFSAVLSSSSSSSCSLRVRCLPCSLVLKVELVLPSLLWSSNVPSSFWSVFQCLSWQSICVHPLYVL